MQRKRWTPDEDLTLRENIHRISADNRRRHLPGRSAAAIRDRARRLGITGYGVSNNGLCYRVSEAAALLGIGEKMLQHYIAHGIVRDVEERTPLGRGATGTRDKWRYRIPHPAIDQLLFEYPMLFRVEALPNAVHRQSLINANPDQWVNTKAASRIAGYVANWLRQLAREEAIPARKVLGEWYFRKEDLAIYRSRRKVKDGRRNARVA